MKAFTMIGIAAGLALAAPASAAVINWGPAQDVSGPGDVSTSLPVTVEAVNLTSDGAVPGSTTVNGVTFTWDNTIMGLTGGTGLLAGATSGDSAYDALLDSVDHGDSTVANPWEIEVGGGNLITGETYEIQIWYTDLRGFAGAFTQVYDDGNGNTVTLDSNSGGLRQFALGTFIADGNSQTLVIHPGGPPGEPHLTAYQIRGVPEPTTFVLAGLGLMSLAFAARRRDRN